MRRPVFMILEQGEFSFRVGNISEETPTLTEVCGADLEGVSEKVATHLTSQGYCGEPVALLLASQRVMAVCIPWEKRQSRHPQALAFAIEEFSPYAAEEITLDAIYQGKEAFTCFIPNERYEALLLGLRNHGVLVGSISPMLLLGIQSLVRDEALKSGIVFWKQKESVELVHIQQAKVRHWLSLPDEPLALRRELVRLDVHDDHIWVMPLEAPRRDLGNDPQLGGTQLQKDLVFEASKTARRILWGEEEAWIELARGNLVGERLRAQSRVQKFLIASLVIFFLCLGAAMESLTQRYHVVSQTMKSEQSLIFSELFPGTRVPQGIRRRLQSEKASLEGTRGSSQEQYEHQDVLKLLFETLAPLPSEMRLHLTDLQVTEGGVRLHGSVLRHGDAAVLVTALESSGLTVESPKTENLSVGVSFSLVAKTGQVKVH